MKALHRSGFFGWTEFNPERNLDFHSVLWVRPEGNIAFDPLPLSEHDQAHLLSLGKLAIICVSNSDHLRDALFLAELTGAEVWAPSAEEDIATYACQRWLKDSEEPIPGLKIFAMQGSKTPGELAFLIQGHTLITGDLLRAHQAGQLCLLPDSKLTDKTAARRSVQRFSELNDLQAILTGDGWPIFRDANKILTELLETFK